MDITEVLHSSDAVLDAFYPGQFGAAGAICHRLSTEFRLILVDSTRTRRYLPADSEHVLLPAFHGLSYTTFNLTADDAPRTVTIGPMGT